MKQLSTTELARFKQEFTDENRLIAQAVGQVLPPSRSGIILDVGAGLGDIAELAFPDRRALLVDILEFPRPKCSMHSRQTIDFFDFMYSDSSPVDAMIMSHVLQYLDDDLAKLAEKVRQIAPRHIIVAGNRPSSLFAKIELWFGARGIIHNGEKSLFPCPLREYRQRRSIALHGSVSCPSFAVLAQQLANVIFDTDLNEGDMMGFEKFLSDEIAEPKISIPQTVVLYEKDISRA